MKFLSIFCLLLVLFNQPSYSKGRHAETASKAEGDRGEVYYHKIKNYSDYQRKLELAHKMGSPLALVIVSMDPCPGCKHLKDAAKKMGNTFPGITVLELMFRQKHNDPKDDNGKTFIEYTDQWRNLLDKFAATQIDMARNDALPNLKAQLEKLKAIKKKSKEIKEQISNIEKSIKWWKNFTGSQIRTFPHAMVLYPDGKGWSFEAFKKFMPVMSFQPPIDPETKKPKEGVPLEVRLEEGLKDLQVMANDFKIKK